METIRKATARTTIKVTDILAQVPKNPLQLLEDLDAEARRKLYPNAPGYAIVKKTYGDKTANALTRSVLRWLELHGHKAWRQTSEGRNRPGETIIDVLGRARQMKGKWLPGQNNGASDVAAIIQGKFFAVEVKMQDKQSEAQKNYQKEVERSGGVYVIARTFEEFHTYYKQWTT